MFELQDIVEVAAVLLCLCVYFFNLAPFVALDSQIDVEIGFQT